MWHNHRSRSGLDRLLNRAKTLDFPKASREQAGTHLKW
jgi:hypothetical protein